MSTSDLNVEAMDAVLGQQDLLQQIITCTSLPLRTICASELDAPAVPAHGALCARRVLRLRFVSYEWSAAALAVVGTPQAAVDLSGVQTIVGLSETWSRQLTQLSLARVPALVVWQTLEELAFPDRLQHLDLRQCGRFAVGHGRQLVDVMARVQASLRTLSLSGCKSHNTIEAALRCPKLEALDLSDGALDAYVVLHAEHHVSTSLRRFDVSENDLGDGNATFSALLVLARRMPNLEELSLRACRLKPYPLVTLANESLKDRIRALNLADNPLAPELPLDNWRRLEFLDISDIPLDAAAQAGKLAEFLERSQLRRLRARDCGWLTHSTLVELRGTCPDLAIEHTLPPPPPAAPLEPVGSLVESWESLALDDSPMPLAAAADAAPGPAAAAAGYYDVPPGVRESTPRSIYHVSSGSQPLYGSSSAAAPASWRPRAQTDANGLRN